MKLCECGCGGVAPIAKSTYSKKGYVKGEPCRFICNHHKAGRPSKRIPPEVRFEHLTSYAGDCIVWTGSTIRNGYGRMNKGGKGNVLAHRFAYEQRYGRIPDGLVIDQICRNRICVNP